MYSSFLYVSSWPESSFLLASNTFHGLEVPQFLYPHLLTDQPCFQNLLLEGLRKHALRGDAGLLEVLLEDILAKFMKQDIEIAVPFDQMIPSVDIFPTERIQKKKTSKQNACLRPEFSWGKDWGWGGGQIP